MQLFLYGGNDPSGLNLGASGAVVANIGSVTVYYNDRTPVDTTNALTAGSTVTLYRTQYFSSAAGKASINVELLSPERLLVKRGTDDPTSPADQDGMFLTDSASLTVNGRAFLLADQVAPTSPPTATGVTNRVPANLGAVGYTPKQADSGQFVILSPGAGTTVPLRFALDTISYVASGNWGRVKNRGLGTIAITNDAGVTVTPSGVLSIPPGGVIDWECVAVNDFDVFNAAVTAAAAATAPVNTFTPTITYATSTFTASPGTWTPATGTTYTYQWYRGAAAIAGQTASTKALDVALDYGTSITVRVVATGSNAQASAAVASNALSVASPNAPANTVAPRILIGAAVPTSVKTGDALTIDAGTWTGDATITYAVTVYYADASGAFTSRGVDTTAPYLYTVSSSDAVGGTLYASVMATNGVATAGPATSVQVPVASTATAGVTRYAYDQPFASHAPWNTAISNAATYTTVSGLGSAVINTAVYTIQPNQAQSGDPLATVRDTGHGNFTVQYRVPATAAISAPTHVTSGVTYPDGDSNLVVVDPTQTFVDETWVTTRYSSTSFDVRRYLRNNIVTGSGLGNGIRASQFSVFAGLIRASEVANGLIPHALVMAISAGAALKTPVWPANGVDSYTYPAGGTIALGSLLAIPPSVNISGLGLSADGLVLARALQDYGAYVGDTQVPGGSTNTILVAEQSLNNTTKINNMKTAWSTLKPYLQRVTNQSQTRVGGGPDTTGTNNGRRQPYPGEPNASVSPPPATSGTPSLDSNVAVAPYAASNFIVWGKTIGAGTNREAMVGNAWTGTGTLDDSSLVVRGGSALIAQGASHASAAVGAGATKLNIGLWKVLAPPTGDFDIKSLFTTAAVDMGLVGVSAYTVSQTAPLGTANSSSGTATTGSVTTTGGATSDRLLTWFAVGGLVTFTAPIGTTILGQTQIGTTLSICCTTATGGSGTQTATASWGSSLLWLGLSVAVKLG